MEEKKSVLLFLNIPFCIRPEKYSSRHVITGTNQQKDLYLEALAREVSAAVDDMEGCHVESVYVGGGSPTVVSPDLLGNLLTDIRRCYPLAPHCEIAFEALPNTVCVPCLSGIGRGRPTRVELMMHSVDPLDLQQMDCVFHEGDVQNAVLFFDKFHLNNVGLHITYGIPGQRMGAWVDTLRACKDFEATHITLAPLGPQGGEFPDAATQEKFYRRACEFLADAGYVQYAAHRFAKSLTYVDRYYLMRMQGMDFMGFGMGAISRCDGFYSRNTADYERYCRFAGDMENTVVQVTPLTEETEAMLYLAGRLRLCEGFSRADYLMRFPAGFPPAWQAMLTDMEAAGYLTENQDQIALTQAGFFRIEELLPPV